MRVSGWGRAALAAAMALGLMAATPNVAAQAFPQIELTAEQAARIAEMKAAAATIDKVADPRAYMAAYEEIVAYAATIYPDPHPELQSLKDEIDFGYFMLGEIERVEANMQAALKVYAAGGPDYAEEHATTYNNLAVATEMLGRYEQALEYQRKAIAILRELAPPEGTRDLATMIANLAWSERGLGDVEGALATSDEALRMTEALLAASPGDNDLGDTLATTLNNHSLLLLQLDRMEEAERVIREAVVRISAIFGAEHPRVGQLLLNGSYLLLRGGQFAESEAMARQALAIREKAYGPETPAAAEARLNLIASLTSQGRHADALPLAEYTYARLAESQTADAGQTLEAQSKLARIRFSVGDVDRGVAEMRELIAFFKQARPAGHRDIEDHLEFLAMMLGRAGRWDEALPVIVELETSQRGTPREYRMQFSALQALRALAEAKAGRSAEALALLDAALPALEAAWRSEIENEGARGRGDAHLNMAFGWAALAAGDAGDVGRSFDIAQFFGIGATERSLLRVSQRERAAGDPELAAALRTRQDLVERRERALAEFQRAATAGDEAGAAAAQVAVEQLTGEIEAQGGDFASLLQPVSLASVQGGLADDAALLFVIESDMRTRIFAVTGDGAVGDDALLSTEAIRALVGRVRNSVDRGLTGDEAFDFAASDALHRALFTPAVRAAIDGKSKVSVIARGSLAQLPFSLLTDGEGGARQWAIERHAFAYPIGLETLARAGRKAGTPFRSFVGIGAPDLPELEPLADRRPVELAFRGPDNGARIAGLGRLGLAETELAAIARTIDAPLSQILAGGAATEAGVRAMDIGSADLLSFATHGLMAGELEHLDEAALVLSPPRDGEPQGPGNDGLLTAAEIAALELRARLVILSACNSASGDGRDEAAFGGLVQAFLHAGAESLLVSHWRVRDDVAARLTVAMVEGMKAGLDPAEALRRAELELIADTSVSGGSHPAIWAPFVFAGG